MSRLQLLQARFQQKQLQEKEQKLLQLYDQQRQRAHQVAQRGSANGNPVTTIGNNNHHAAHHPTPKARHMQHERLGQQQKGIDKSYPLEPLDGVAKPRKPSLHRARRTGSKPDVNSNSESHESILATSSTSSSRVNGHYEINIDEVIDDEAMQRNRMYAKFQPRTTTTAETTTTPSVPLQRKNTTAKKPTAMASPRQSTVMKVTKSSSLKIRQKVPRGRRALRNISCKESPHNPKKQTVAPATSTTTIANTGSSRCCKRGSLHISDECDPLKSTSLIYEAIKSHSRVVDKSATARATEDPCDSEKLGKVKSIVMKIENITSGLKASAKILFKLKRKSDKDASFKKGKKKSKDVQDAIDGVENDERRSSPVRGFEKSTTSWESHIAKDEQHNKSTEKLEGSRERLDSRRPSPVRHFEKSTTAWESHIAKDEQWHKSAKKLEGSKERIDTRRPSLGRHFEKSTSSWESHIAKDEQRHKSTEKIGDSKENINNRRSSPVRHFEKSTSSWESHIAKDEQRHKSTEKIVETKREGSKERIDTRRSSPIRNFEKSTSSWDSHIAKDEQRHKSKEKIRDSKENINNRRPSLGRHFEKSTTSWESHISKDEQRHKSTEKIGESKREGSKERINTRRSSPVRHFEKSTSSWESHISKDEQQHKSTEKIVETKREGSKERNVTRRPSPVRHFEKSTTSWEMHVAKDAEQHKSTEKLEGSKENINKRRPSLGRHFEKSTTAWESHIAKDEQWHKSAEKLESSKERIDTRRPSPTRGFEKSTAAWEMHIAKDEEQFKTPERRKTLEQIKDPPENKQNTEESKDVEGRKPVDEPLCTKKIVKDLTEADKKKKAEVEADEKKNQVTEVKPKIEELPRRPSAGELRRQSFELKRQMFELILGEKLRRDSVESALQHFDSISVFTEQRPVEVSKEPEEASENKKRPSPVRGFEKPTTAWEMHIAKEEDENKRGRQHQKKARKSLPDCSNNSRRRSSSSRASSRKAPAELKKSQSCSMIKHNNNEETNTSSVLILSLSKSNSTRKPATTPTNTTTPTTNGSSPGISSGTHAPEPKSRPQAGATKSSSMKFLSRIVGTNGDLEFTSENGYSSARKSSLPRQDSPPLPAQHSTDSTAQSQSQQQKTGPPVTPAPRTSTTLSSPNSAGTKVGSSPSKRVSKVKLGGAGAKSSPGHDSVDSNLTACKICSRRFTSERIALHEQICAKTAAKKRKQFDVQTHRVKGTELESFHKPLKSKNQKSSSSSHSSAVKAAEPENKLPKSNWRRKHEDFINAIRSAKQMQAYLASGGKLSDLPPPPPSDTSDYVQCPHCSRKFNSGAAQRHIPKCQTMQHNKPKVAVRSKR